MRGVALAIVLVACSSGETFTEEHWASDAGLDVDELACGTVHCVDSFVICEYCTCPGKPCRHVDYATGSTIADGVCGDDLVCSAPCQSPTKLCPP